MPMNQQRVGGNLTILHDQRIGRHMLKRCLLIAWMLLHFGCASYGVIANTPQTLERPPEPYSITAFEPRGDHETSLMLAFSGGGTRAAALSYGVLEELRDTVIKVDGNPTRVLDEVDVISSVSGGSFTSAYYGLKGDAIFDDFETVFLRRNIQGGLIRRLMRPKHWFSKTGRTDMAVKLYEEAVFQEATFADMKQKDGPLIIINASDLSHGVRFSFIQEYFSLLCSDIASFPVARAVTASSSVPVLFNPVVIKNFRPCQLEMPDWLASVDHQKMDNLELEMIIAGLQSYYAENDRDYVHLVDGGITDNLGLRAIYEMVEVAGGAHAFIQKFKRKAPRRIIVISVDASTSKDPEMDKSPNPPSMDEIISAVSTTQLHRYSAATKLLMDKALTRWAEDLSTAGQTVDTYFISISFSDTKDAELLDFFNLIPTSFTLSDEQVDACIKAGHDLLRDNAEFKRFLADLEKAGR